MNERLDLEPRTHENFVITQAQTMKLSDDETLILTIKGSNIDEDAMQKIRRQINSQLGNRVLVLGADEDIEIHMATVKTPPSTLAVKVSGAEIFKAVKNYIKNSDELHAKIKEAVKTVIEQGGVSNQIQQIVKSHFASTWGSSKLDELAKKVITEDIRKKVDQEIASAVQKVLERAVFVMPPKETTT